MLTTGTETLRSRTQAQLLARLPEHVGRLGWDAERVRTHQRDELRNLLTHAVRYSPFHARRLAGLDPAEVEPEDVSSLPVMTKAQMMAELDDIVTDRRLNREVIESTLAGTGTEPRLLFDNYVCLTSGGSSGTRGVFVLDVAALVGFMCSIVRPGVARMGAAAGTAPGRLPPGGLVMAMVGAASAVHATGLCSRVLDGEAISFTSVPVTLPIEQMVARLNAVRPQQLMGYPSMLARLAREQRARRLRIAPASIACTGETLLPEHHDAMTEAFGVPPGSTFGSSEGLVGVSPPGCATHTFASDLCIVELVDERYRPVPAGTPSARVLVTNLYNRVQPLIRYELADSLVCRPDAECGHLRATVAGRNDETLRFGDVVIHPLVIRSVLIGVPEVVEYQVRQTGDGIDVAVVADLPFDRARLGERLRSALAGAGVRDAEVAIRTVHGLERHPETGKCRRFVPVSARGA